MQAYRSPYWSILSTVTNRFTHFYSSLCKMFRSCIWAGHLSSEEVCPCLFIAVPDKGPAVHTVRIIDWVGAPLHFGDDGQPHSKKLLALCASRIPWGSMCNRRDSRSRIKGLGNWEMTRWGHWGTDIEDGEVRKQKAESRKKERSVISEQWSVSRWQSLTNRGDSFNFQYMPLTCKKGGGPGMQNGVTS